MSTRQLRLRFIVALVVFTAWIAGLATMAVRSGERPRDRSRDLPVAAPADPE